MFHVGLDIHSTRISICAGPRCTILRNCTILPKGVIARTSVLKGPPLLRPRQTDYPAIFTVNDNYPRAANCQVSQPAVESPESSEDYRSEH